MTCIYRLTGLKKLFVTTTDLIEWKLSLAMLEEMNPNLTIISEITSDETSGKAELKNNDEITK